MRAEQLTAKGEEIAKKKWTYQEYSQLGEDTRFEIIEGEAIMTPAPNLWHQWISRKLEFIMVQYVTEKNLGEVFDAPLDVILDETHVVQPDIVFVSKNSLGILHKKGIVGAPDLVVEILSPHSLYHDRHQKQEVYAKFKIPEYWIVDAANQSVEIFTLVDDRYVLCSWASISGKVKSNALEGFELEISAIMVAESEGKA